MDAGFNPPKRRLPSSSKAEQGYLLLGLLFLIAILMIGLAIAAPRIGKEIQREKEAETIHRGEQYKRAIQLYYRKFGHYPMSIDQLKKTDNIRFLRQEYIDPMTGKKDWKLLHLGEVPMVAMGLFGKPMVTAGATGGMPVPGMPGSGMPGSAATLSNAGAAGGFGSSTGFGSTGTTSSLGGSSGSSIFSNSPSDNDSSGSSTNGATNTADATPNSTSQNGGTDASDQDQSSFGSPGSSPFGTASGNTQAVANTFGSSSSPSGFGTLASQSQGATGAAGTTGGGIFGGSSTGAPIIGVTVPLNKKSILSYRMKTIYDKWYFIYNPQEEVAQSVSGMTGGAAGSSVGTPAGSTGSNPGQTASPFGSGTTGGGLSGSSNNSSGFGSSGFGSSGSGGFGSSGLGSSPNNSSGFGSGNNSNTF